MDRHPAPVSWLLVGLAIDPGSLTIRAEFPFSDLLFRAAILNRNVDSVAVAINAASAFADVDSGVQQQNNLHGCHY